MLLLLPLLAGGCKARGQEVLVFAAASLARSFSHLEERVEADTPGLDVVLEISGSQVACRKLTELNRRADVVAVADHRLLQEMLIPAHARYNIRFTANEVVLAHMQHSRHTEEITADNWYEVLSRPGVRLGLVDPALAPIGYRTRLVWQLAQRWLAQQGKRRELVRSLEARCAKEHVTPHEGELLQLLQSRTVDYVFVYRSSAEEHNLKVLPLPDAYNLGAPGQNDRYAAASIKVRLRHGSAPQTLRGAAVVYGVTIPRNPPNPAGAETLVRALLNKQGRRILRRTGFRPLAPARCGQRQELPASLRALTTPPPKAPGPQDR